MKRSTRAKLIMRPKAGTGKGKPETIEVKPGQTVTRRIDLDAIMNRAYRTALPQRIDVFRFTLP